MHGQGTGLRGPHKKSFQKDYLLLRLRAATLNTITAAALSGVLLAHSRRSMSEVCYSTRKTAFISIGHKLNALQYESVQYQKTTKRELKMLLTHYVNFTSMEL